MNSYSSKIKISEIEHNYNKSNYTSSPIDNTSGHIIEGDFSYEKPMTIRAIITRKINKTLTFCLILTILVTFISYYITMIYEARLNVLDNDIVRLNAENQDLQNDLDKYKSFSNVDTKLGQYNALQKAGKVIEITAINPNNKITTNKLRNSQSKFNWAIGY